jgi:hypothetical protein
MHRLLLPTIWHCYAGLLIVALALYGIAANWKTIPLPFSAQKATRSLNAMCAGVSRHDEHTRGACAVAE